MENLFHEMTQQIVESVSNHDTTSLELDTEELSAQTAQLLKDVHSHIEMISNSLSAQIHSLSQQLDSLLVLAQVRDSNSRPASQSRSSTPRPSRLRSPNPTPRRSIGSVNTLSDTPLPTHGRHLSEPSPKAHPNLLTQADPPTYSADPPKKESAPQYQPGYTSPTPTELGDGYESDVSDRTIASTVTTSTSAISTIEVDTSFGDKNVTETSTVNLDKWMKYIDSQSKRFHNPNRSNLRAGELADYLISEYITDKKAASDFKRKIREALTLEIRSRRKPTSTSKGKSLK